MPTAVGPRRHPGPLPELAREGTLVVEAAFERRLCDARRPRLQCLRRRLQPSAHHELLHPHAEEIHKPTLKLPGGEPGLPSERGNPVTLPGRPPDGRSEE